jgi:uncharacterized membrane protein YgcG
MTTIEIVACVGGAGLTGWFIFSTIRDYRRKQAKFQRDFYERWPPPPPAPRRESARRQIISPSWGTGKTRGSASSDSWSLTGISDSPTPAAPEPAPFHGGGGDFGGGGASGGWGGDSCSSSDSGSSSDGGGSCGSD